MTLIIEQILSLYQRQGGQLYFGEPVTQLEHAIQTALAAQRNKAPAWVVTAALLHDVGHLLISDTETVNPKQDAQHELIGFNFLQNYFHPDVAELVKQHVNAKRYLTAINPQYAAKLSTASQESLRLQGGPMSNSEIEVFKTHPLFDDILRLRYWDEGAKIPHKKLPCISDFVTQLQMSLG